jgi:triacylglycerol esterase/lipase EstA (alpha/beta hydrolase family)
VRIVASVGIVAAVAVGLLVGPQVAPARAEEKPHYPVPYTLLAQGNPGANVSPPGSNDWSCKPSDEHPNPVVLVHGLGANQSANWQTMSPLLANAGYCVFSLTYGVNPLAPPPLNNVGGLRKMEDSAAELGRFVDRVLDATDAKKVDIVGHSEGSLMPNYYVKFLGGDKHVDHYVGMTPLWDGSTLGGVSELERAAGVLKLDGLETALFKPVCASCRQFLRGSDFLKKMNSGGGPRVDGVDYTMIMTKYDEAVIPYTSGIMDGATNIVLQDGCPTDYAEHGAVAADPVTGQHILNALDPEHAKPVTCYVVSPIGAYPPYVP